MGWDGIAPFMVFGFPEGRMVKRSHEEQIMLVLNIFILKYLYILIEKPKKDSFLSRPTTKKDGGGGH